MTKTSLSLAAVGLALVAGGLGGTGAAAAAVPQFTPLSAKVLAPPAPAVGTDGRRHLVYELELQNTQPVRVDVLSLAVRAGDRTLRRVGPAEIPALMTTAKRPGSTLAAGEAATLWLDVTVARIPRALRHRLSIRVTSPEGESVPMTFDTAPTAVDTRPRPAIAAPLRGGLYLNFNGCCELTPHRTALFPIDGTPYLSERFAVDLIRIDAQGRGAAGDFSRNESFFTYGEGVHAVAAGRVIHTRNDVADNPPLNEPRGDSFTAETILGNHVVVRLRDGRYATFAHLQPGSVRVRPGQRVRTGQLLGRVGNSGQSGGAHLHFQLSGGPSPVASDGLPFAFARFSLVGAVGNVEQFLAGAANADIEPLASPSRRGGELPLHAAVVRFPG
jgi:hypothetical protein